ERGLWSDQKLDCNQKESNADFLEQKTSIAKSVEAASYIFELYPKFYCECNFIECYWGAAKQNARQQYDYLYAQLQIHAWRYIEAYTNSLEGKAAERAIKQFKSHR
ncbi:43859_t:CDS:2, partial [Gigaspora margarita]